MVRQAALVGVYLAAIVLANQSATRWVETHPEILAYNAFVFIALDLTTRDALHSLWRTRLVPKMAVLIAAGSALSYLVNRDSARIALASCVAFACAAVVDTIAYQLLRERPWFERATESNVPSAGVDSIVFPWIVFGALSWPIVFSMFTAKVAGGVVWAAALRRVRR